jgi:eukaryotic-like serine/threonine-protein kinase
MGESLSKSTTTKVGVDASGDFKKRESPQSALRRMTPLGILASPALMAASRERLGWLAATAALLTCTQRLLMILLPHGESRPLQFGQGGLTLSEMGLIFDASLILIVRAKAIRHETVLRFGFIYQVLRAFTLSLSPAPNPDPALLTWAAFLAVTFPLILPQLGLWSRIAPVVAAATQPLGVWSLSLTRDVPPEFIWKSAIVSSFAALVALLCSELVRRIRYDEPRHAGSYNLVEKIGEGGMGEVWIAEHRHLLRPAAIKLIPRARGARPHEHEKALRRFRREAQVTALLTSPHTVQVYDYGVTETGLYYYVMEYLDGMDLQRLVSEYGPIPAGRAVFLLVQVADSLGEAHRAGLIHRDIKPSNLMVVRAGEQHDFVKVLDFGLVGVKQRGIDDPAQSKITKDGVMTGTPAFVSPEMVRGDAIDGRADIYALGCVLYYLVTGRLVFPDLAPTQMALAHAHEVPPPPSRFVPGKVPADLEELILTCLDKQPERRPQTARDLALRLGSLKCAGTWTAYDAEAWWNRELDPIPPSRVKHIVRASDAPLTE